MSSFNITPFPPQTGIKRPVPIESGARRTSIEGLCPYEDWLRQCFYPLLNPPTKNEPPMRGSLALPEFVSKNPNFPDLAQ